MMMWSNISFSTLGKIVRLRAYIEHTWVKLHKCDQCDFNCQCAAYLKKQKQCHTSKSSLLSIALQPRLLGNWLLSLGLKSQIHISRLQLLLQWLNHFIFARPFAEKALQANQNSMTAFLAKLGISGMLVVDKLHFRGHKVAPSSSSLS